MPNQPKRADRLLWATMIGMMVAAAIAVVAIWQIVKSGPRDEASAAAIGGPFELVDQSGKTVTDQTYKGRYRLIYFGYTFCPDACPTELQTMALAVDALGPAAEKVQPIFISIDPERDTPQQLAGYVPLFDPRLVGLTGTPEQIAKVAKEYKVYFAKAQQAGSTTYLMNHSSFVYVMDPDDKFLTVIPGSADADKMAAELRKYIGAQS